MMTLEQLNEVARPMVIELNQRSMTIVGGKERDEPETGHIYLVS